MPVISEFPRLSEQEFVVACESFRDRWQDRLNSQEPFSLALAVQAQPVTQVCR